ncbi:MAG TPA: ubiquinol-cytochrome c reductase iron-sulfur subunit [Xanthobacteraceae bacterium]
MDQEASAAATEARSTRRDVLRVATGAGGVAAVVGAVGAAAYVVPLLDQSSPDAVPSRAADAVDVDLSPLQAGQQIMVFWRSWPVFVVRRSAQALATLRDPDLLGQLADPDSDQLQQPPYAKNSQRSIKPEFAVLLGICTHMGCTPTFYPRPSATDPQADWIGGYLCPCHGSKYDLAGRVFKDVPAPYNLPVPPHRFVGDTMIRIGENPSDVKFDFNAILQI